MGDEPLRGVFREDRFNDELQALIPQLRRADDFVRGAEWLLARNVHAGTQIAPGSPVWGLPCSLNWGSAEKSRALIIFYAFDDQNVTLLSIQESTFGIN